MRDFLPYKSSVDSFNPSANKELELRIVEAPGTDMSKTGKKSPCGIGYAGEAGVTAECKNAVMRLIQFGDRITHVRILSHSRHHAQVLTINCGDVVAIKSGFGSGYLGEGARGFSFVLQLLQTHGSDIQEYEVDEDVIGRLDMSSLTVGDMEKIGRTPPVRPSRWYDYILEEDWKSRSLSREFPAVVPWGLVDGRITDLASNFFEHPDKNLLTANRRLEDTLRKRTGSDEHGAKLFSEAFHGENAKLFWKGLTGSEATGRANLFTGAFMAYRNPRAHRELENDTNGQLAEFLLVNHLFCLEKDASEGPQKAPKGRKRGVDKKQ